MANIRISDGNIRTDKDFKASLKLLQKVEYINSYSFLYSPRPGTPASKLEKIEESILKKRLIIFQKFAEEIKMKYKKNLINKKLLVLFENKVKGRDEFFGRDEFSNSVIVKSGENLIGKLEEISIIDGNQNTLFGVRNDHDKKEFAA